MKPDVPPQPPQLSSYAQVVNEATSAHTIPLTLVPELPRYGSNLRQRVDDPHAWPCLPFDPAKTDSVRALHAKYAQLTRASEDLARRVASGEEFDTPQGAYPSERARPRFFLPLTLFGHIASALSLAEHLLERANYPEAVGQLRIAEVLLRLAFTYDHTDHEAAARVEEAQTEEVPAKTDAAF